MNVDAIRAILRHANADGAIDDALRTASSTWERRQRFVWTCFIINAILHWIDEKGNYRSI